MNLAEKLTEWIVTIFEISEDKSEVHLACSLNEIVNVELVNNDLKITIQTKSPYNNSEIVELNVMLNDIYQDSSDGKKLKHHYQLYTQDGFCLNPILKNNSDNENIEKFYEISYFQEKDYIKRDTSDSVRIHKEKNYIVINNHGYRAPIWGEFNFHGDIENLTYTGSEGDDELIKLNRNSYIMATKGNDVYQLKTDDFRQSELTVDLANAQGKSLNGNSIIIKLPDEYGRDLRAEGQSVYFKNIFNDKKLNIKFINYENNRFNRVYIKDKAGNLFQIKLSPKGHEVINQDITKFVTQQSDDVYLRTGRFYSNAIIDTLAGDDNIENNSGFGVIVNAGDGNDKIKATRGRNVFYGGDGDDIIDGGNQGDLLLSDLGNDILNGKKGNDHYIVDGSKGAGITVIDDEDGINNIHLMHFNKDVVIKEESTFSYQVYRSKSTLREVRIKILPEGRMNKNHIHHYDSLRQHVPHDVKESMGHMVRYLAEHKQYWEREKPLLAWKPMYAFKGVFNNTSANFVDLTKSRISFNQNSDFKQLVVNLNGNSVDVTDKSGHGRFFKTEAEAGRISVPDNTLSHNVFYAGKGHAKLIGGGGDDVFILNGCNSQVMDKKGDNVFVVDGGVRGESTINYGVGNNEIHLISFNETPVILNIDDKNKITQYIYQSESGYKVTINQADGVPAPKIIHHNLLPGMREYTTQQKLEYLGNTLATMRLHDEHNSHGVNSLKPEWNPASLVRVFIDKGTVI